VSVEQARLLIGDDPQGAGSSGARQQPHKTRLVQCGGWVNLLEVLRGDATEVIRKWWVTRIDPRETPHFVRNDGFLREIGGENPGAQSRVTVPRSAPR
jgi:hypothetical protein